MDVDEPLIRYLANRIKVLFQRRYKPAWKTLNVFLCGAAISKNQNLTKTAIHFEVELSRPETPHNYWWITYHFHYCGHPRVDTQGSIRIVDGYIRLYNSTNHELLLYELSDPECMEKIVGQFKEMFKPGL